MTISSRNMSLYTYQAFPNRSRVSENNNNNRLATNINYIQTLTYGTQYEGKISTEVLITELGCK